MELASALTAATILADAAVTPTVSEMTYDMSSETLNHTQPNPCAVTSIFLRLYLHPVVHILCSRSLFQVSWVFLFLCGLAMSTMVPAWQCCHYFFSMCDQTSSIFSVRLRSSYARYCCRDSVCSSFCLSNAWIVIKQKHLAKNIPL